MTIVAILLVVVILAVSASLLVRQYLRWRAVRVVTCPETQLHAAVKVNALRATRNSLRAHPALRLSECSRWPERAGCGQECLKELQAAPDDCLVRNILGRWYEGKACALCGKAFGVIQWHDHAPALLTDEQQIRAWADIPPDTLPDVLDRHRPVCWDCQVAETFRHQYLDRVTDR
jgi:type II secretory pathway pseudopilin PulG